MDIESFFLNTLRQSKIIGNLDDDCALLRTKPITKKGNLIVATDSFIEGSHFLLYAVTTQWISYKNLARKAFLITISDIISSGAKPRFALLAITLPSYINKANIKEIIDGLQEICLEYQIMLIGGDTIKGSGLGFHVTIMGELQGRYLSRRNVLYGDLLAYTSIRNGNLGRSLQCLRKLLRYGVKLSSVNNSVIESSSTQARFINPVLRAKFLFRAQKYIHACMDISDGLGMEIHRLQHINNLGLCLSKDFKAKSSSNVYQSGEEYELLFSFSPKDLLCIKRIAKLCRIDLHIVGRFARLSKQRFRIITWH